MRIVHILENADDTYGGPARSVPYLAAQLQCLGNSVELRTTYSDEAEHNSVCEDQKIPLKRYRVYGPTKLRFSRKFLKDLEQVIVAKKNEKIILHVHNLRTRTTFVAYLMKRRFPKNVVLVVSPRGSLFARSLNQKKWWKRILGALFQKHMLRIADRIHVTSDDEQSAVEAYVSQCTTQVISNGIDLDEFQTLPSKDESAAYFDLNVQHTHVLFLWRVHIKKWFDRVVDAFIALARDYPDMVLLIAWPKEDLSLWEKSYLRLQDAWLLPRVKDLGMVREKERAYAFTLADIFVLPSETENFWIVIAEALACEDVVIVSNNTPRHDLNSLQAGYCIPLKDFTQTWEKVLRLTKEERDAIGKRWREYVYQNYDWKMLWDEYEKMYATSI